MIKGQKRLLLILAILGDIFEDLADAGGLMSFSYQQIYGYVPRKYKKSNFEAAIRKAMKVGSIERVVRKGQPCLKLMSRGKNRLAHYFPLLKFQKGRWDRKWRIVFFDIEEKNRKTRELFRRKLYELGFGKLQKSVYVSPFPIEEGMREFIESCGLKQSVYLVISSRLFGVGERSLVRKVWALDKINMEYKKILRRLQEKEISKSEAREIKLLYLEILTIDPFLPKELLPKDWLREEVERKIRQLRD